MDPGDIKVNVRKTNLPGVLLIEPTIFQDERGYFVEAYQKQRYADLGLTLPFVQDNISFSRRNTLRGLHFQNPHPQGKLLYVLVGEILDVAVDIRINSSTFGHWVGLTLSADNKKQVYVPPGFAHGFCVMSEVALLAYKCTDYYYPEHEGTILWNDPELNIAWPIQDPILAEKDRKAPLLEFIRREQFIFE